MSSVKIKKCPYNGDIKPKVWIAFPELNPDLEYVYLECTKIMCEHCGWDCRSEPFLNNKKGKEATIIDWNRKMDKKIKKQGGKKCSTF